MIQSVLGSSSSGQLDFEPWIGKSEEEIFDSKVCFSGLSPCVSVVEKMSADVATMAVPVKIEVVDDADDDSSSGLMTFSDSDPKDSGVDCGDEQNSELPDDATAESILKMVEFYLSDENILKDAFLLKHVRRNKEGYISVKLLASFRKVRSLCKSWKAVAYSVAKSKALALNSDGTKVRRVDPLPDHDETVSSRSVIAHGFASDRPSVDTVGELFAHCGDIALVRILRPGGSVPADVKRFLAKNPEVQARVCALVEFEDHASAKRALGSQLADGVRVIPVTLKSPKPASPKKEACKENAAPEEASPKKKKKNRRGSTSEKKSEDEKTSTTLAVDDQNKRTRRSSSGSVSSQSSGYLSSSPASSSSCYLDPRYPRRHSFNPSIYNDPNSSFASLNSRYSGSRDRLQRTSTEGSSTLSPWRRRREQQLMQSDSNLSSSRHSGAPLLLQNPPVQTIRAPRGPDGTRGFLPRARLPSTAE